MTAADEGLRIRLHTTGDAELELWAAARHAAPLARCLGADIHFELAPSRRKTGKVNGRVARKAHNTARMRRGMGILPARNVGETARR